MRVLVGTLYAGENELDDCLAAIAAQSHSEVERFVVRGMGEKEAHDVLYGTFMERSNEVDLFVKVDADMVIADRHLFSRVVSKMKALEGFDRLTIGVHDYFSGLMLLGLHVYRNHVRWPMSADVVFPDRRDAVSPEKRFSDRDDLAPAATHCGNPGLFQSFRFGLHRGVKLVEMERRGMRPSDSPEVRQRTWERFLADGDTRRAWASLGFELAIQGEIGPENRDFEDPLAQSLWKAYRDLQEVDLVALVERLRGENAWLDESFDRQASARGGSAASSSLV